MVPITIPLGPGHGGLEELGFDRKIGDGRQASLDRGARSSALGRDVGRTAQAPRGSAARRARRCIIGRAEFPSRSRSGYGAFLCERAGLESTRRTRCLSGGAAAVRQRSAKCVKNCARWPANGQSERAACPCSDHFALAQASALQPLATKTASRRAPERASCGCMRGHPSALVSSVRVADSSESTRLLSCSRATSTDTRVRNAVIIAQAANESQLSKANAKRPDASPNQACCGVAL